MTGLFSSQYFWAMLLVAVFILGFWLGWRLAKNRHDVNIRLMTKLARLSREQRGWRY
jgi:hypothetical protein